MMLRRMTGFPRYGWASVFDNPERIWRDLDRLMGQSAERPYWPQHSGVYPLVNITETKDNFFIRSEIPGMKADDIQISATGTNLSIAGERKIVSEGENVTYHRREREGGKFNRMIALPSDIQVDKVEATYADGVLVVSIPKAEEAKPKQIKVK